MCVHGITFPVGSVYMLKADVCVMSVWHVHCLQATNVSQDTLGKDFILTPHLPTYIHVHM